MAVFDNRGIGASSVPADRRQYTTDAMAQDALAVMVGLGLWEGAAERAVMACTVARMGCCLGTQTTQGGC